MADRCHKLTLKCATLLQVVVVAFGNIFHYDQAEGAYQVQLQVYSALTWALSPASRANVEIMVVGIAVGVIMVDEIVIVIEVVEMSLLMYLLVFYTLFYFIFNKNFLFNNPLIFIIICTKFIYSISQINMIIFFVYCITKKSQACMIIATH